MRVHLRATISTRLLYGTCREGGIKVVLVGEGADELFGGYDVFRYGTEKNILRRVARRVQLLPEETLTRPKLGGSMAASWLDEQSAFGSFAKGIILAKGGWTEALELRPAMIDYFVNNRAGYKFLRTVSIFRNLAWRLLILEMWSNVYRVAPDVC